MSTFGFFKSDTEGFPQRHFKTFLWILGKTFLWILGAAILSQFAFSIFIGSRVLV